MLGHFRRRHALDAVAEFPELDYWVDFDISAILGYFRIARARTTRLTGFSTPTYFMFDGTHSARRQQGAHLLGAYGALRTEANIF